MAGIYIHIPFCNSKCAYCGFYSIPSLKRKGDFLDALRLEIFARRDYLEGESIGTIYFGGGTPSLLSVEEIGEILQWITGVFTVNADAEITLEANPDTLSLDYLKGLRAIGVNRLSIGIQSFFDNDLKYLSRRHDSRHALECVSLAKEAGFENISLDLIYGLPTSDAEQWHRNLELFFEMDVPHLSAYALTLEPNSILTKQIEMGKVMPINEEDALRDYEILCRLAKEAGFLHYEISNFCKPGSHSRHNSSYWFGVPYLGLGPSAHSYNGTSRQWNVSSVGGYLEERRQKIEARSQESEARSQQSEAGSQESEAGSQESSSTPQGSVSERRPLRNPTRQCGGTGGGGGAAGSCGAAAGTGGGGGAAGSCGAAAGTGGGGDAGSCGAAAGTGGGGDAGCVGAVGSDCGADAGDAGAAAEYLTAEQVYDEYVMLRLRTMWGIDLNYIKREMGERFADHCERQAQPLVEQGKLSQTHEILYLNDEQMLFADGIAEALFW